MESNSLRQRSESLKAAAMNIATLNPMQQITAVKRLLNPTIALIDALVDEVETLKQGRANESR